MILKKWYLNVYNYSNKNDTIVYANGVLADEHPVLSIGEFITTSYFEELKLNDKNTGLDAITHSGSHYELLFEENDCNIKTLQEALECFNIKDNKSILENLENCKKNKEINDLKEAEKLLNNNELLLIMTGSTCISAYMKFENNTTKVRVHTHIGTFQDSVLISNNKADFRYFPEDDCLEIYHWSDGLNNVLIKNIGKTDIKVLDTKVIICKADKITKINGNQPHNEELISPDFVNGKNILTKK